MSENNNMKVAPLFRNIELSLDEKDVRKTKSGVISEVKMAFSSEYPYQRSFGMEILDHSETSVDLTRLANKGAFLLDHDTKEQIGVVKDVSVGEDRVLRGTVKFSRSAKAQDVYNDIVDGIRSHVSIGYVIRKMQEEDSQNDIPVYRVTDWMPFEASLVSVPADPTVGVGRSFLRDMDIEEEQEVEVIRKQTEEVEEEVVEETTDSETVESTEVEETREDTVESTEVEETREAEETSVEEENETSAENTEDNLYIDVKEIRSEAAEIVRLASKHNLTNKVPEWLTAGRTLEQIAKEILDMSQNEINAVGAVELTEREQKEYSIVRAVNKALEGRRDSFEYEVSDEIAKRTGRSTNGFYVPTSLRAMNTAGTQPGSELVFETGGSFIDLLRKKTRVIQLGAQVFSGLTTKLTLPRMTSSGGSSWIAEDSTAVSQTTMSLDQLSLAPKTLASATAYSRQLLAVGNYDVENLIRNDFARSFATAFDAAAIAGSGTSNQPTGILYNTSVNNVSASAANYSGSVTYDFMVDMWAAVMADNTADSANLAYLTTPQIVGNLATTVRFSGGNLGIMEGGKVFGYPVYETANVPSDLTYGSTTLCHGIVFGDWSQLILAEFGAMEIIVDPYSSKRQGLIELAAIMLVDIGLRHPDAFAKNVGLVAS